MDALVFLIVAVIVVVIIWVCLNDDPEPDEPILDDQEYEEPEKYFAKPREMNFEDYIGQAYHVERVKAAMAYADHSGEPMKHMAFVGSAGTGKTALASCVSLGRDAVYTTGQAMNSIEVLADVVNRVDGGIVFIDEAHDLKLTDGIVTGMLPLLEDFVLSTPDGTIHVKPFTCIMATTNWGDLDKAIRSRMGLPYELDPYSDVEMKQIVKSHAKRMEIEIDDGAAEFIALRSRKNPRGCSLMLTEARNHALVLKSDRVTVEACVRAFELLRTDRFGLREQDRRLLSRLLTGPCAKTKCAGLLGMDVKTFEATVSTYLFNEGLISVSSKGTEITEKGRKYIGDT